MELIDCEFGKPIQQYLEFGSLITSVNTILTIKSITKKKL